MRVLARRSAAQVALRVRREPRHPLSSWIAFVGSHASRAGATDAVSRRTRVHAVPLGTHPAPTRADQRRVAQQTSAVASSSDCAECTSAHPGWLYERSWPSGCRPLSPMLSPSLSLSCTRIEVAVVTPPSSEHSSDASASSGRQHTSAASCPSAATAGVPGPGPHGSSASVLSIESAGGSAPRSMVTCWHAPSPAPSPAAAAGQGGWVGRGGGGGGGGAWVCDGRRVGRQWGWARGLLLACGSPEAYNDRPGEHGDAAGAAPEGVGADHERAPLALSADGGAREDTGGVVDRATATLRWSR
jgi:hypothetical protein